MLESNLPELFKSDFPKVKLPRVSKCPEFEDVRVFVIFSDSWVDSELIIE